MKKILHITSSTSGEASYSIRLGKTLIEKIQEQYPESSVLERNVITEIAPELTAERVAAMRTPEDQLTPEGKELVAYSDKVIEELMESDIIVISVPMINFSIPAPLKAWLDSVTRGGKTFKYGEFGPEGLITGKKVYLAIATGGIYSEGPMQSYDFIEPYLRTVLGFVGMTDVTVLRAEGTAMPGVLETALEKATAHIDSVLEDNLV